MKPKRVLMIIAKTNFRDEEFLVPYNAFKNNNIEVTVASTSLGEAHGVLGAAVEVEKTIYEVNPADFDAVAFIGGAGSSVFWKDAAAHKIAQEMLNAKKVVAAICIAPVTLANAGILNGKNATVFQSETAAIKAKGANYTGKPVEVDGNLITANGPNATNEFANEILKKLK